MFVKNELNLFAIICLSVMISLLCIKKSGILCDLVDLLIIPLIVTHVFLISFLYLVKQEV